MKNDTIKTVLIFIIVIYIITKLESFFNLFGEPEGSTPGSNSENLPVNENKLSYPANNYELWADAIYNAVWEQWGGFIETDKAVRDILLLMQTDDDFYQLSDSYGKRGKGVLIKEYYSLSATVANFLDNNYKGQVNEQYAENGMTVRV